MTKGFSNQCKDILESKKNMKNVLELAKVMGFDIETLTFGKKQNTTVVTHNDTELSTDASNLVKQPNTGRTIDEIQVNVSTKVTHTEQNSEFEPDMKLENTGIMESSVDGCQIQVSLVKTEEEEAFPLNKTLMSRSQTGENGTQNNQNISQIFLSGNNKNGNGVKQPKFKPQMGQRKKRLRGRLPLLPVSNIRIARKNQTLGDKRISRRLISECQVCKKLLRSEGHLRQHLVKSHFLKEMKERFDNLVEGSKCLICDTNSKDPIAHIGATHKKVNEILIEKGLTSLSDQKPNIEANEELKQETLDEKESKIVNDLKSIIASSNLSSRRKKEKKINSIVNFNDKAGSSEQTIKLDELSRMYLYTEVESVSECQVCKKSFPSETRMRQHLVITHFVREVRERCATFFEGSRCLICDKTSKNIILHIGATHRKVNGILIERNYKPFATLNESKPKIRNRKKRSELIRSSGKLGQTTNEKGVEIEVTIIKKDIKEETPEGELNPGGLRQKLVELLSVR